MHLSVPRALIAMAALLAPAPSQPQDAGGRPEFEVASVKPSPLIANGAYSFATQLGHGELKLTGTTLRACIRLAYGVKDYQISGPEWLATQHYDILAKAAGPVPDSDLKLMLRSLLAGRFKLEFHNVTKSMPAYALVVAKNGPKVAPVTPDGPARFFPGKTGVEAENVSMARFAELLSGRLDRPVLDATGPAGVFNLKLDFAADLNAAPDGTAGPTVFAALQEQLGLKLEARQAPLEMMIVDRADKVPVEN